jgi:Tetratricopeptide repeat
MLAEDLMALASLAGQTVVKAAPTDTWEAAKSGFARLLSRGDPKQEQLAEHRLEETREQLAGAGTSEERVRATLAGQWATRLADLLDVDPSVEADLRVLVQQIQREQPAGTVSADGLEVAAGQDVNSKADRGGVAVGTIHAPPEPGLGAVFADRGAVAISRLDYRRKELARQPVQLAPRPQFLAGREELLAELHVQLAPDDDPRPRIVTLFGPGAGKTSVALEYAYRHLAEVGLAWQFPAEDQAMLRAGFDELAAQLGAWDLDHIRDAVTSVHTVLAKFPAPWLLIFDNASDPGTVEAFLPPAGPGQVLITSQNSTWPGQALHVPGLNPDVAADFLISRTCDPDERAAAELAGELDGLPLALEQAAAYMRATGDSIAEYLGLFRKRRPDTPTRGEPLGYGKTVGITWALAFSRLEQAGPSAAGLMRLLAFFMPEAIPLSLLLQPRPGLAGQLGPDVAPVLEPLLEDPLAASDAVAMLRRYSLVTPAADGSVSVHRLVQAATIEQMTDVLAAQWRQAAVTVLEAAIPGDPRDPSSWPVFRMLLPHAQAALTADAYGMARAALYLGYSGSFAAARDLCRTVLEAREQQSGPAHPDTLAALTEFAHWTGEAGGPGGARDQYAELVPVIQRVLGPEHPDSLAARGNLARWTGRAGDPGGARDQYAELVPVIQRVLGPEHPETLATRNNLARWTGEAGDPGGARDQYAELVPVIQRVLGPEHPETLATRHNLARWTGEAGDASGARDLFAALVPAEERVLGPEHPYSLATRNNLARWTGEAGDPAAAWDQCAALVPTVERVLGPEHPFTLAARDNLAHWTGEAGDSGRARDLFAALLPAGERVLGSDHPETLAARGNLARWTGEAGDPVGARDQYAELVPVIQRVLGPEHRYSLTARYNLARWTGEAGDPGGARDQCAALLSAEEQVFGPEHPYYLTLRANLARWTGEVGDPVGARDRYAELLPVIQRVFGPEHPETLVTRSSLAYWARRAGR